MKPLPGICAAIGTALGRPFRPAQQTMVAGGSIHRACTLADGDCVIFVKLNDAAVLPQFEAEADGLRALAQTDTFCVPRPITLGVADGHAFLALEHLMLEPLASREDGIRFAEALAQLHHHTGSEFGWKEDNFIGATPQQNAPTPNWPRFFATRRLAPQLQLARAHGYRGALQKHGEAIIDRLAGLFIDYHPQPSLLHGDLWHGNTGMALTDGLRRPALFDPAVYRGDREADVAMSELFGGFPSSFYAAYRAAWGLDPGYEGRKNLYNLYHVLNHLNLFGGGYLGQAERMAARLATELGAR